MARDTAEAQRLFDDWRSRALERDLLSEAQQRGANLKKKGREWIGPCPACGGRDRFSINQQENVWCCRPDAGGDVIELVKHLDGVSFLGACEALTGEPPPRGRARPISAEEQAERERRRVRAEQDRARREKEAERYRKWREHTAQSVWQEVRPMAGTLAEAYMLARGVIAPPGGWPAVIGFHPSLEWERGAVKTVDEFGRSHRTPGPSFPCLVARVDDFAGDLCAVWRIFLDPMKPAKAPVEDPKLGMGTALGGAVRLGGIGEHIGVTEGLETAFGAWALHGFKFPVWPTLSTNGMVSFEPPEGIKRISVFPDGDKPIRKKDGGWVPVEVPPGRAAAIGLHERLALTDIACAIEAEPAPSLDYLDLWNRVRRMEERIG